MKRAQLPLSLQKALGLRTTTAKTKDHLTPIKFNEMGEPVSIFGRDKQKHLTPIKFNEMGEPVSIFGRNKQKHKQIDMSKKLLNNLTWITDKKFNEIELDFKLTPEYPNDFRLIFGSLPVFYSIINDRTLCRSGFKKLKKFLFELGFTIYEQSKGMFKYAHVERGILIFGDIRDDMEFLDDDSPSMTDDNLYFQFYPHIENKEIVTKILNKLHSVMEDKVRIANNFYMIAQNQHGLYSHETKFKAIPIKDNRYDIFYGKDFPHETLRKFITDETDNLMLLHGDPGTGKSNYIKHIITESVKNVIYIPPSMLSVLATPGFVSYVMQNQNSILLIEDAEEVLSIDRNSATNNLLGLTDGFLKDALGLKIICTFNCNIGKIDPALLRKGRLYFEYKFDKLSVEDGQTLSDFMNLNLKVTEPMSLAEIFNPNKTSIENSFEEKFMGFR